MSRKRRKLTHNSIIPYLSIATGIVLFVFIIKGVIVAFKSSNVLGSEATVTVTVPPHEQTTSTNATTTTTTTTNTSSTTVTTQQKSIFELLVKQFIGVFTIQQPGTLLTVTPTPFPGSAQNMHLSTSFQTDKMLGDKVIFETLNGKMVAQVQKANGKIESLGSSAIDKINEELSRLKVQAKISIDGIEGTEIKAVSSIPLLVSSLGKILVKTSQGEKELVVLPDRAVKILISANIISGLSGAGKDKKGIIVLGEKDGIPVYKVTGIIKKKFFNFISFNVEKTVTISAQNGRVLGSAAQGSTINRFLNFISF